MLACEESQNNDVIMNDASLWRKEKNPNSDVSIWVRGDGNTSDFGSSSDLTKF